MMSAPGLRVRCLASTSVTETRQVESQTVEAGEPGKVAEELGEEDTHTSDNRESGDRIEDVQSDDRDTEASTSASSDSSTDSDYSDSSYASSRHSNSSPPVTTSSCIQEAQLSPDGTCIFTSDYSRAFSVYPISSDILHTTDPRPLTPYAQFKSADPIWAFAANPLFNLQDSSSTHVLVSRRDRYITLHNALWDISSTDPQASAQTPPIAIDTPVASYKLINHLTEAVTAPLSLAYSPSGTHFFAGGQNSISIFDLTSTDDPIHTVPTIPSKRNKLKGGGRGFKGYVSALAVSPPTSASAEGLVAAGTRTRYVGIYDCISGSEVTHFSLPGTVDGKKLRNDDVAHIMGDGVSSLKWSPCGRYLYIAERESDVLLIYDVRKFSLALGHCAGRKALTKQKLGFDVWNAGASPYDVESIAHEVWAGGTDGKLRVWKDPYRKEGAVEADEVVDVGDEEPMPVVSTLIHSSGSLAVTARGTLDTSDSVSKNGIRRGGGTRPRFTERGCLDILGLSSY